MELVVYRTLWGLPGVPSDLGFRGEHFEIGDMPFEDLLESLVAGGADGLEYPLPAPWDVPRFREALAQTGLRYIAVIDTSEPDHLGSFQRQLERAAQLEPDQITCQGGRDSWDEEEVSRFFRHSLTLVESLGLTVGFETHRQRALFTPWRTARLLDQFADLTLTLDLSHWVVVAERLLEQEEVALACDRAVHLQGRVGHEEGPQVTDPRAPEVVHHRATFESWWKRVLVRWTADGREEATFNPEYGPPPYMPASPYTGAPMADLEEINRWAVERFRELVVEVVSSSEAGEGPLEPL